MPDFITYPVSQDPDDYSQRAYDFIQTIFPNWEPHDGQLDSVIIQSNALRIAVLGEMLGLVTREAFRDFGQTVIGLPSIEATAATASTTWTARDTLGITIEAGWQAGIRDENGDLILFEVAGDVVIPTGSNSVAGVIMNSVQRGEFANSLTGAIELAQGIPGDRISNVTLQGTTSGGADEETIDEYTNRLAGRLGLMSPRPMLAEDFAKMAPLEFPQIHRAIALDNFIPPATFNAENAVGLAAIDVNGNDLSPTLGTAIDDYFQSFRAQNFVFNVVAVTYTNIAVTFAATSHTGYDTDDVETRAVQAVIDYLSPADWGTTPGTDERSWEIEDKVRLGELYTVLNNVLGLRHVTSLTFAIQGQTLGTADITLPGVVPLPRPSTGNINGSVT